MPGAMSEVERWREINLADIEQVEEAGNALAARVEELKAWWLVAHAMTQHGLRLDVSHDGDLWTAFLDAPGEVAWVMSGGSTPEAVMVALAEDVQRKTRTT